MKNFFFLTGLPRTGSTLLSSILAQNPDIHAEGGSAVCQLMWDMHVFSIENKDIRASNRADTMFDLIKSIPEIYYKNVTAKNVVDKFRQWTIQENIDLIEKYITSDPKFIVTVRPVEEIVKSFIKVFYANNSDPSAQDLFIPETPILMRPVKGVLNAINNHPEKCIFITYDDLVKNTKETINDIYEFCGWEKYEHNFNHVKRNFIQIDEFYGFAGLHDVRNTIEKVENNIELDEEILKECYRLNNLMRIK